MDPGHATPAASHVERPELPARCDSALAPTQGHRTDRVPPCSLHCNTHSRPAVPPQQCAATVASVVWVAPAVQPNGGGPGRWQAAHVAAVAKLQTLRCYRASARLQSSAGELHS
jgi:hypothetical protein